jgi:hypothetical protein
MPQVETLVHATCVRLITSLKQVPLRYLLSVELVTKNPKDNFGTISKLYIEWEEAETTPTY